ncbi:MAG: hypothetical protein ACD_73C00715G0002 [uncultured bacterium]|nr:MAG: hypothetical protein ACD_73C00715G0002 [uncultured bacterium]
MLPINTSKTKNDSPNIFGLCWAAFLGLAFYYSGFFVILTPIVYVYLLMRYPLKWALLSYLLSLIVVSLVAILLVPKIYLFYQSKPQWEWLFPIPGMGLLQMLSHTTVAVFGIAYFVGLGLLAYSISRYFLTKYPFQYLMRVSLMAVLLLGLGLVGYSFLRHVSLDGFLRDYYLAAVNEFIALEQQAGLPKDQIGFIKEYTPTIVNSMTFLTPSFCFVSIVTILLLNIVIVKKFFLIFIPKVKQVPLNEWVTPFAGVWVVIAALSLFVGWIYELTPKTLLPFAGNALLMMTFLYYIQGLSVVSYFLEKKGVRLFSKIMIYSVIFLFFQMTGMTLVALGFSDSWFDLRKLQKNVS